MPIAQEILKKLPKAWQTAIKYAESRAITLPVEAEKAVYQGAAGKARAAASEAQAQAMAAAERAKINFPQYGAPGQYMGGVPSQAAVSPGPTQAGIDYMSALPKAPIDEATMLAGMRPGIQETVGSVLGSQASQGSSQLAKILNWAKTNPALAATGLGAVGTLGYAGMNLPEDQTVYNPMGSLGSPQGAATTLGGFAPGSLDGTKTQAALRKYGSPLEIVKAANAARQQASMVRPSMSVAQAPNQTSVMSGPAGQQPNKFWEWFKQYGIPLTVAGVGLASKNATPFAAGYAQEYVRQKDKNAEADSKKAEDAKLKDIYIFDEEKGKVVDGNGNVVSKIPSNAEVVKKSRPSSGGLVPMPTGGSVAPTAADRGRAELSKATGGTQRFVVNGTTYDVPNEDVEEFKAAKGIK
jgi:hypothetical protein